MNRNTRFLFFIIHEINQKQMNTSAMVIFVRSSRQALPPGMDGSSTGPISESDQEASQWMLAVAIAFLVLIIVLAAALVLQFYYPDIVPRFKNRRQLPSSTAGNGTSMAATGAAPRSFVSPCGQVGCDRFARLFESQLNRSVDPCQDLRAFSCAARPRWRRSFREEVVENASRAAMVNVAATGSRSSAMAKASTFYRSCVASKTPLDLQSLRAFLTSATADTESTMPKSSKAFQVMSKMAARYGSGILFRLGTGFLPENGSRIVKPALVLGLHTDFKRWMYKAKLYSNPDAHKKFVDLVLSLSMSRDDFRWHNASEDVMTALGIVKGIWRTHDVSRSQQSFTNMSQMGAGLRNINPAVLLSHLWRWGATYSREHAVVLEQSSVLEFLDSVMERVDERRIVNYLIWETTRQMSAFFLHANPAHLEHLCYTKTVELFGPAAALAPVIWNQVSAEAVVSAESTFASVLKASEYAIYAAGARSVEEAKRMKALGKRLGQVRLVVSYPEDVHDMPTLNEKLAHVPGMSEVFFTNLLMAQESSWKRKKDNPSLPAPLRSRPHYDELRNEITLPIDFLIPPWFSPESPPSVRLATIGLSLSLVLWRAIETQRVYYVGESSRRFLADRLVPNNHTCMTDGEIRSMDDANFRRLAVMTVVTALNQTDKGSSDGSIGVTEQTVESANDNLELLLLSCCLSTCGPHSGNICAAVMGTPQFGAAFRCAEKGGVHPNNCFLH
ncbi:hypothetical protein HPB50_003686 [Hyalomma asiaticum]|uniref:Uncharacterized protein n=1 Tax=Hyalomma asiaticum TaxID=266040 RepID=A0ACB7SV53_HYAAI|nr:hypothetical protein HPB50_003686 [Hyalomma asiaticum]